MNAGCGGARRTRGFSLLELLVVMVLIAATGVLAAGVLSWREKSSRLEVLLVHRPRYDDWSVPKGKLDKGETFPAAAVREVAEETAVLRAALDLPS